MLLITIVAIQLYYPQLNSKLNSNLIKYNGFTEAGDWVKRNVADDALIITGSPRFVRYYTGINFQEFGGRLMEIPKDKKVFETVLQNTRGPVVLLTHVQEIWQPTWIYPLNEDKINSIESLGFQLSKRVDAKFDPMDLHKNETIPLIYIFQKK